MSIILQRVGDARSWAAVPVPDSGLFLWTWKSLFVPLACSLKTCLSLFLVLVYQMTIRSSWFPLHVYHTETVQSWSSLPVCSAKLSLLLVSVERIINQPNQLNLGRFRSYSKHNLVTTSWAISYHFLLFCKDLFLWEKEITPVNVWIQRHYITAYMHSD